MNDQTFLTETPSGVSRFRIQENGVTIERFTHCGMERLTLTQGEMDRLTEVWTHRPMPRTPGHPQYVAPGDEALDNLRAALVQQETCLEWLWRLNVQRGIHWTVQQCEHALTRARIPYDAQADQWLAHLASLEPFLPEPGPPTQE